MEEINGVIRDQSLYYRAGYKYVVTRPYNIKLDIRPHAPFVLSFETVDIFGAPVKIPLAAMDADGLTTIYRKYCWNGASGPTIDTLNSMIGSLVHDFLYQCIRLGHIDISYKEYADYVLKAICVGDGMFVWRAGYWEWAVNTFGIGSCRPSAEPQEQVAP